ncbi:MAG: hypothetical protein E6Q36_01290 [Chryseobacterium sp.]|nr:MAG: hypothetical protein E6Q36_01290 [Chryseobacterium sp.]
MKFKLANPKTELDKYLVYVEEVESPGLISQAHEWIMEGWGLGTDSFPQEEQIAAALLMEAKTQDSCVKSGETHPDYPKLLRSIAHKIMILAGHW